MSIALLDPSDAGYKAALRRLKKSQKTASSPNPTWTPFRAAEKRYMQKYPPPDLSGVLDLAGAHVGGDNKWKGNPSAFATTRLLRTADGVQAYTVDAVPGLVLLPCYLDQTTQRDLVRWSLSEHARAPNETNLDAHYVVPPEGIWNASLHADESTLVQPKAAASQVDAHEPTGPRQLVNNEPAGVDNFETLSAAPKPPPAPSPNAKPAHPSSLLPRLRWANIGYSYHWGSKSYDFSKETGAFPALVSRTCKAAVAAIDWNEVWGDQQLDGWGAEGPDWPTWAQGYAPDAGIVNFYQLSDTLMGHVDRSELSSTSPLVSISLGNAAILLMGSSTRDTVPLPILLRSGDVLIMSGPHCRRAYHGVPRILDKTLPQHLKATEIDPSWDPYASYLETTRININVRQVFPPDFVPPQSDTQQRADDVVSQVSMQKGG